MQLLKKIKSILINNNSDTDWIREWTADNFIHFYMNDKSDTDGRMIEDILSFNDIQLEKVHDYIQEIFPTDEESAYNLDAPVFEKNELRNIYKRHIVIRNNITSAFNMMVDFWGLRKEECPDWFYDGNHNCLRVTRVLKSLNLFGAYELADELTVLLKNKIKQFPNAVPKAEKYWKSASKYKRDDLQNRLENYYDKSIENICIESKEEDFGKPMGEEIW